MVFWLQVSRLLAGTVCLFMMVKVQLAWELLWLLLLLVPQVRPQFSLEQAGAAGAKVPLPGVLMARASWRLGW